MDPIDHASFSRLVDQGFNVVPLSETLQLDRETPVSLYQRFGSRAIFLLESAALGEATGRYSFIGLDRRWRVTTRDGKTVVDGTDGGDPSLAPLEALRHILARYRTYAPSDLPDFFGGAVGFVTYDYVRRLERLPREAVPDMWPDVDFSFPGAVLICDHVQHSTTAVVNAVIDEGDEPNVVFTHAREELGAIVELLLGPEPPSDPVTERLVATAPSLRSTIDIRTIAQGLSNFTRVAYGEVVERAREHVFAGDVFQVVPSQQFRRPSKVNPLTLYRVLRALNPSPYMYLLDSGQIQIVGASPEMLMRVHDGLVSYRPIAGTRARGATETEDIALEHELLHDEKEIAEHVMLVDLGRNDVGRVATTGTVRVDRLAHIERYSHLMHLVSHVEGRLREGLDAFDAFDALFPAGTLTGAPKVRAMELIDEFEPVYRGPYGGAVGYFSLSGNADFAITIRTLSLRAGVATVQAGGGVVADSQPESEYEESINKASAPLLALEIADPSGR
ncbi:MAG TPA: anthranilate synthase component I family protein [Acidimicrobiales bacterium]|nr:anthranilate synthase component I family protein [Acidimicrobiales bacterium]